MRPEQEKMAGALVSGRLAGTAGLEIIEREVFCNRFPSTREV